MAAQPTELHARIIDLFGSPATADPTKLYNNLGVSSNGNVVVGAATSADDGSNKLQVTGNTKFNGGVTLAQTSTNAIANISNPSGYWRGIQCQTSGSARWGVGANQAAETGSNVGSDFTIDRYNDSGVWQNSPITITRSNGSITLNGTTTLNGATTVTSGGLSVTGGVTIPTGSLSVTGNIALAGSARSISWTDSNSAIYEDSSGQGPGDVVIRTGNGGSYYYTIFQSNGVANFPSRPGFGGATPWDSANVPGPVSTGWANTFTSQQYFNFGNNLSQGAVHVNSDWANSWGAWTSTANVCVQQDCPSVGSAYHGFRWTRWGGRHLACISGYEPNTTSSPALAILVGTDSQSTGPGFQFMQGGVGTYGSSWTSTSDYRVKTDVENIDKQAALAGILKLRPVEYSRVEDVYDGQRFPGYIAHEVQEEFPLVVHGTKDAMKAAMDDPEKEVPDLQSVDYIKMTAYHTAAIQALMDRLDQQQAQINSLQTQVFSLQAQLASK